MVYALCLWTDISGRTHSHLHRAFQRLHFIFKQLFETCFLGYLISHFLSMEKLEGPRGVAPGVWMGTWLAAFTSFCKSIQIFSFLWVFTSLSVKGVGAVSFPCGFSLKMSTVKWWHVHSSFGGNMTVCVWQGSETWIFDFTGELLDGYTLQCNG